MPFNVMTKENLCDSCDLCCRKYKIYLFPKEAKRIAKQLKINYKDFVFQYLDFYLEIFDLPEGYISEKFIPLSEGTVLFPCLAIKQKEGTCILLENHICSVYKSRPIICQLFPKFKIFGAKYSFCKLDKKGNIAENDRKQYYPILNQYLEEICLRGMKKTWKYMPSLEEKNIYLLHNGMRIQPDEKVNSWLKQQI